MLLSLHHLCSLADGVAPTEEIFHSIVNVAALCTKYSKLGAEVTYSAKRVVKGKEFTSGRVDLITIKGQIALVIEMKCKYTNPSENVDDGLEQVFIIIDFVLEIFDIIKHKKYNTDKKELQKLQKKELLGRKLCTNLRKISRSSAR